MAKDEKLLINAGELARKIESFHGEEKQRFCRTLSMEQKKAYVDYCRDRDTQMVRGTFRCYEPVGGSVTLTCRPYEGCEYNYTLEDGKEYTIPIFLAKRLNGDFQGIGTWYPTHSYAVDVVTNKSRYDIGKKNYRFSMTSSDFAAVA